MKKLEFRYMDLIDVSIHLRTRRTILNGDSATGKSYIFNIIKQYAEEVNRDDILCLDTNNVDERHIDLTIERIRRVKSGIVVIDRSDNILNNPDLYDYIMSDYDNYYIIIGRKYYENYSELAMPLITSNKISIQYKLNII
jgi:hypothetical protein